MTTLFGHAASISGLTLVSRVLGVVRDAVIAAVFGISLLSDAFFLAFRPFDLIRKLFSDGTLSLSLVPVFSRYLARGRRDEAVAMFWSALVMLSAMSAIGVAFGIYAAPFLVDFLAPGFARESYSHTLTAVLLRLMLPYLSVILFLALCMGFLNAQGRFKGAAATPILLNIGIIASVWLLTPEPRVLTLGMGVTLGGVLQVLFQVPVLYRGGMGRPRSFHFCHPGAIRAARRFFPCMLGASAFQINLLVSALFASTLAQGSISHLYYAERLVQFPMALLVSSAATVFLPALSRAAAGQGGTVSEIDKGIQVVLFLTMGAMAGIMALDRHIVALLFGRGAFDTAAVDQTANCLFFMVPGLWAMAGTRLLVIRHFAASQFRLPVVASGASILVHVVAAFFLNEALGVTGLALALALGSLGGFLVLGGLSGLGVSIKRVLVSACRALLVSGIMACLVRWAADGLMPLAESFTARTGVLLAVIGLGGVSFLITAMLVARPEMTLLRQILADHHDRN